MGSVVSPEVGLVIAANPNRWFYVVYRLVMYGSAGSECVDEDCEQEKQVQGEWWAMVVRAASQRESSYIAQVSAQSQVKERRPSVYLC